MQAVVQHFVKLRRALWTVNHDPDLDLLSSQAQNLLAAGHKPATINSAVEKIMRAECFKRRLPPSSFAAYKHSLPEAIGVAATGRT